MNNKKKILAKAYKTLIMKQAIVITDLKQYYAELVDKEMSARALGLKEEVEILKIQKQNLKELISQLREKYKVEKELLEIRIKNA